MRLYARDGRWAQFRYNCKTWRCLSCRDRLKTLFIARVQAGITTLTQSLFTTITYKVDAQRSWDAGYVGKDWKALWRKLRGSPLRNLLWLRVMELTKKKMPHHHLVMGWPQRNHGDILPARCWPDGYDLPVGRYRERWSDCNCVAHHLSRAWWSVTGDSWIVDASTIYSPAKAAEYLAKYTSKEFDKSRAKELGMERRWSTSRGWPGSGRLHLAYSNWEMINVSPGERATETATDLELLKREGPPALLEIAEKWAKTAKQRKLIRSIKNATAFSEA